MKTKELIKIIEKDGWAVFYSAGEIRQFNHPLKLGIITINSGPKIKLGNFAIRNVLEMAGLR